jgi:hypothetical protein
VEPEAQLFPRTLLQAAAAPAAAPSASDSARAGAAVNECQNPLGEDSVAAASFNQGNRLVRRRHPANL